MTDVSSLEALEDFAKTLASKLEPYDVLVLDGDLGAGKTQLTKFLCKYLGVESAIGSPTFPIVNTYEGKHKIFHFDVYRLETKEELQNIGFDEYLNQPAIIIIEWGSKFDDLMPDDALFITINMSDNNNRTIELRK